MIGIYQIRNKENGNIYIGSSNNIEDRWKRHKTALKGNRHHNCYLQRAWNKYGKDYFVFETLVSMSEVDELPIVEQWFLDFLITEYNISKYTDAPTRGTEYSQEYKDKMSQTLMGREYKDEWRKSLSEARQGIVFTAEHRANLRKKHPCIAGEKHPGVKLTEAQVLEIRKLYATGEYSHNDLGKKYNVHRTNIYRIINRKTWKHI